MTEDQAIKEIEDNCRSDDYELNGSNLDRIVNEFLRSSGFTKLADTINNVDCWRA